MDKTYKRGDQVRIVRCTKLIHKRLNCNGHVVEIDDFQENGIIDLAEKGYGSRWHCFDEIEPIEDHIADANKMVMTPEQVDERVKEVLERAVKILSKTVTKFPMGFTVEHDRNAIEVAKLILQVEGNK
jgi:hypothetical protein